MSDPHDPTAAGGYGGGSAAAVAVRLDVEATARDRTPLEVVLNDLQNSSQNVHALLDELTERLRPVLREPIEGEGDVDMLAERERLTPSPLVVDLEGEVRRGYSAQSRIRDLLDRLEA